MAHAEPSSAPPTVPDGDQLGSGAPPARAHATVAEAAEAILADLARISGLSTWMVLQEFREQGVQMVVALVSRTPLELGVGDRVPYAGSLCERRNNGAPWVAVDAATTPGYADYAAVRDGHLGSLLSVPLAEPDGSTFGSLCGVDAHRADDRLRAVLPTVEVHARLLSTLLALEQRVAVAELQAATQREAAEVDPLTGLGSRRRWDRVVGVAEHQQAAAVLVLDLDGLKAINDARGHEAGDVLLRRAAEALREALRPGDETARLGGDELVALLPGCGPQEAEAVAARLRLVLDSRAVRASVGAAARQGREPIGAVQQRADEAMYALKRARSPRR